ncbi:TraR/DksA family transcriptional regulator [Candidatus Pantoea deserta]|uniref:TraR/DksA family transcriptional regulator n=1 Tax=Candidatus Pantoea deserta TaxID=1869313 RepID=A0A3N4P3N7_9GAMM|nr:TraR/DksA C4-type zinc finger protein [Pantoea deserta]RPD99190.1 TraR/DksA family transcriptional regulator [Pantoea deserta]
MVDIMDREQQRQAEQLALDIAAVTQRPKCVSAFFCQECDSAIPEARRRALSGVSRCVACQEIAELRARHYQSGR